MILFFPLLAVALLFGVRAARARFAGGGDAVLPDVAPWSRATVRPVPDRARAITVLALREARQILTHPSILVGLLLSMLFVGSASLTSDAFDRYLTLTGGSAVALYLAPLTFFAANLSASRSRRARANELLDATPATPFDRTLAQCLAALGPALVSAGIVAVTYVVFAATDPPLPATPPFWALFALPLSVLGAGTLGVLVARWLPFRGAALVVMVALVLGTAGLGTTHQMLASYVEFPEYTDAAKYVIVPRPAGAHAVYVLGLDLMAAIGALLVHRERRRLLLGLGALVTAATAWAGVLAA